MLFHGSSLTFFIPFFILPVRFTETLLVVVLILDIVYKLSSAFFGRFTGLELVNRVNRKQLTFLKIFLEYLEFYLVAY